MHQRGMRPGAPHPRRAIIAILGGAALAVASALPAWADPDETTLDRTELLEILRTAPPAPNPPPPPGLRAGVVDPAAGGVPVAFDLRTGQEIPAGDGAPASGAPAATEHSAQRPPHAGMFPAGNDGATPALPAPTDDVDGGDTADGALAPAGGPTQLQPVYGTLTMPWRTIAKMLMRFGNYYYVCSGALVGSFHLLTAGHCIFNWDPNDDGNTSDAQWADAVWVWPGQTDLLPWVGEPEWPFGEARAVLLRSYEGWTSSQAFAWDWGVVVLNRRDGDHTGWMGRETNTPVSSLNHSGYPAESPYVPFDNLLQYHGYDRGNVLAYGGGRIRRAAFVYGGHSGGPVWRYDASRDKQWIQGVMSTSDRRGYAEDTLLTNQKFDDLDDWIATDEAERPPVSRPDLTEYVFQPGVKALLDTEARPGDSVRVRFNVLNAGFADSGPVEFRFFLWAFDPIELPDVYRLENVSAYAYAAPTTVLTIPHDVPPGSYYVGWTMYSAIAEYSTTNNTVLIADQALEIAGLPTPTQTRAPTPTATRLPCPGDCTADGTVQVSELVTLLNVTLGNSPITACPAGDGDGDGEIVIREIVAAVRAALEGC